MNGYEHYAVLSGVTALIAVLTGLIWLKTRQIAFVLGSIFLYYWSLYGAWNVIARGLGSSAEFKFEYMFKKLFPVHLDSDYTMALLLYGLFIVSVQLALLVGARRAPAAPMLPRPLLLDHRVILLTGAICSMGALWIVRDVLSLSAATNVSPYAVIGAIQSGSNPGIQLPLFSLYQVLNETALVILTLGTTVLVSGRAARYIQGRQTAGVAPFYAVVLGGVIAMNMMMGSRSTMVFAILPCGLFYLANALVLNKRLLALGAVLGLSIIMAPGILRSASAMRLMSQQSPAEAISFVFDQVFSQQSESFASHASMYGVLSKNVPLTYGGSLLWLATSPIPRVIRPVLVEDSYQHYAVAVGAARDQGFTIHHATGWYLNFGVPGVILGGIVFGFLWAWLHNRFYFPPTRQGHFSRAFFCLAVWNVTGFIPVLIRQGPEGYKGLFVESLIIPSLIVAVATLRMVMRNNRPCVVRSHEAFVA